MRCLISFIHLQHKLSREIERVADRNEHDKQEKLGKLIETIYLRAAELSNQTHPDVVNAVFSRKSSFFPSPFMKRLLFSLLETTTR